MCVWGGGGGGGEVAEGGGRVRGHHIFSRIVDGC